MKPQTEYADIHVYAQGAWHDDAYIIGTRKGLHALMDAIKKALDTEKETLQAMTGDGEGYSLGIALVDDKDLPLLQLPYTDEIAIDSRSDCKRPHTLTPQII